MNVVLWICTKLLKQLSSTFFLLLCCYILYHSIIKVSDVFFFFALQIVVLDLSLVWTDFNNFSVCF